MNRNRRYLDLRLLTGSLTAAFALAAGVAAPSTTSAALLLPRVPLFVNTSVTPNIFMQMDDSGSMDWDILTPTHFTTCRYNRKKYCSRIETTGEFYDWTGHGSRYRTFEYVETSQDDAYNTHCYGSNRDVIELCGDRDGTAPWDWRVRSSDLNVLYFNPSIQYQPWPGYSDASFGAARSYPDPAQGGYYDTDNLAGFEYHVWIDDKGFSGSRPDRTDDTNSPNGIVDEWDSHVEVTVGSGSYSCRLISYSPDSNGLNASEDALASSDPLCQAALGVNASAAQLRQNVANWFQYFRRRNMVARASVAQTITDLPAFRYGFSLINDYNLFVEVPPKEVNDFSGHNAGLVESYLEYPQQVAGTPLRRGLERVGRYYDDELSGKADPIVSACQKNFTILFSDGYWNGSLPYNVRQDVDGDNGVIFDGTSSETRVLLADVAKYYYDKDLSPLPDLVPTDQSDAASHQHMVTFTVGFGITGSLVDTDDDGWPNNLDNGAKWYLSGANDNERRVDDLWHAAWNSRGQFISAKRPEDLMSKLTQAILSISDRVGGAASGATNGGSISGESKVFQAKFDALDWHGSLLAINVNSADGELDTIAWEAGAILNTHSNSWFTTARNVYTYDADSANGRTFKWNSLSSGQQALVNRHPETGVADGEGEARVNYIRGSDAGEGSKFRSRDHRLGDIAHSDPEYVSFPSFFYSFGDYANFANANAEREAVVYVGANDGMLHAFRESDGTELFAYVPDMVIEKLPQLTSLNYYHDFFVDGSPVYGDIQSGSGWKSVLVSSLRGGGQGLFALDITDPLNFEAADVLWEFSDADDADLGYVFGEPQIRKMANGKWAAVFTSGYNNIEDDGRPSPEGRQFVYVAFINEGENGWSSGDFVKIEVPGADGLSAPAVADVDGDAIADFIYVGDLDGNLWKLDVTASSTGNWGVSFGGEPLFVARDGNGDRQPITTRPAVSRHPLSIREGVLVLFGTGKYLEVNDDVVVGAQQQSVYAIWDRDGFYNAALNDRNSYGDHNFDRAELTNPQLEVDPTSNTRVVHDQSDTTRHWFDANGDPNVRGWVVDLPVEGERVIRRVVLRDNIALLVTLIPEDDECAAGGSGWLMALNAETGNAPRFPVIDITDDSTIDSADVLMVDNPYDDGDDTVPTNPVGVEMLSIPNLPALLYDDRAADLGSAFPLRPNSPRGCGADGARSFTYTTRTNGSIMMIATADQPLACGRQNWLQSH